MPLTDVWSRNRFGEWMRTSIEQADAIDEYAYGVPAEKHHFRCYKCFNYVTFVKAFTRSDGVYVRSQFRHSSADEDKNCEDRSKGSTYYTLPFGAVPIPQFPLRIVVQRSHLSFQVGFLPLSEKDLNRLIEAKAKVVLQKGSNVQSQYLIDYSRFAPGITSWIDIDPSHTENYNIDIVPSNVKPSVWSGELQRLSEKGTLFNIENGRIIPEKSDVSTDRDYYLLCGNYSYLPRRMISMGVLTKEIYIDNPLWKLYQINVPVINNAVSDLFFDDLHLRLTAQAAEIEMLCPPVIEKEDLWDTNQRHLAVVVKGDADPQAYPAFDFIKKTTVIPETDIRIIELNNNGVLQLVCSERYSQMLSFRYIRPLENRREPTLPSLEVTDNHGNDIANDMLAKPPQDGQMYIRSEVDGFVEVFNSSGFFVKKDIKAGNELRVDDLRMGTVLKIWQGLSQIRTITIQHPQKKNTEIAIKLPWTGKWIPFPSRHAGILQYFDSQSSIYSQLLSALQQGEIPHDAWKHLQKIMEASIHE